MTIAARTPMTLQEAPSIILSGQEATVPTAPQSVRLDSLAQSAAPAEETFIATSEPAPAAIAAAAPEVAATVASSPATTATSLAHTPATAALVTHPAPLGLSSPSTTSASLPMLGAMVLVVGLIVALGKLVQKLQKARGSQGGMALQVKGGVSLSQRERLVWVQAGEKHLLLGVSPGSVQTLHVFDGPLDGEALTTTLPAAAATAPTSVSGTIETPASQDFASRLQTMLEAARSRSAEKKAPAAGTTDAPAVAATAKAPALFSFRA